MGLFGKFWSKASGMRRSGPDYVRSEPEFSVSAQVPTPRPNLDSLPRFHGSASDFRASARDDRPDSARARLRNAFTPTHPVSDLRMFAGRGEILRSLIRAIEDQQLHVVVYGDRGIGKTSLLHVLSNLAREARYLVRYTSCSETSEFNEIMRAIMADIPLLYHSDADPTSDESERGGSLADLLGDRQLSVAQVSEIFAKLAGTRVLIILDEYDRSTSPDFRRLIAELIKNLSDRAIRVQLVIAGVASNLTELIDHIPSIRRNIIGLPVGKMSHADLEQLIRIGEQVGGLDFSGSATASIIYAANGSPYLASLLCQHGAIVAIDRNSSVIEQSDIGVALDRALAELRLRISPQSLRQIAQVQAAGLADPLHALARCALDSGGRIEAAAANITSATIGQLVSASSLIAPLAQDGSGGYGFVEEGVPSYLWMLEASRSLAEASDPEPVAVVSLRA